MANHQRPQAPACNPLYETPRQTAVRLTTTAPIVNRLIEDKVLPARRINGSRKIPKVAAGLLLASAYEIWPPECRPHYTPEELRRLAAITVEKVAAQLSLGRSAGYDGVRKRRIPAIQLPNTDRWVVPEDAAMQMEIQDLARTSLLEDPQEMHPLNTDAGGLISDDEAPPKASTADAARTRQIKYPNPGLAAGGQAMSGAEDRLAPKTCDKSIR